jgi:nitrous-oxide reductase
MKNIRTLLVIILAAGALGLPTSCGKKSKDQANAENARAVYVPIGQMDKYYAFLSGGQSGCIFVHGLPSGRLLTTIPVFEPRAGFGYGMPGTKTYDMIKASGPFWGDAHHPMISETHAKYDGKWLFINDKANARIARIDLSRFETEAIAKVPNVQSLHGIAVVPPDTKYIIGNCEFDHEIPGGKLDVKNYKTVMAFINPATLKTEFEVLTPGNCDIADASKDGRWAFCTSYNTEHGLTAEEMVQRDEDALFAIDIPEAEKAIAKGEYTEIGGTKVIDPAKLSARIIYVIPVPKNPHGCDVTPDGKYVMATGKLSPTVTIIDISKIDKVKNLRDAIAGQPEVGLGGLHTTFDGRGNAYTSLFVDSQIVKWNIDKAVKGDPSYIVDRVDVHYNPGHTMATQARTVDATGEYLLSLNKMSKDMFLPVGKVMPECEELMLLSTFPSDPEPHDAAIILASTLAPHVLQVEPEAGPHAVKDGEERVVRTGPHEVHVYMTAIRSRFTPTSFEVKRGDKVTVTVTNIETMRNMTHGWALTDYGINMALNPGETKEVNFTADKAGTYWYYCTWFCSALHLEMRGRMLVE